MKKIQKMIYGFAAGLLIVTVLAGCQGPANTEAKSEQIARNYLVSAPTFKYDGVAGSMKLVKTEPLAAAEAWEFTYQFDCAHSGYGNRTGQVLLQVITPHTARIRVERGTVMEAIIDTKWDEKGLSYLETPPSPR